MAKVYEANHAELVGQYLKAYPLSRGIAPADVSFVVVDRSTRKKAVNVLLARKQSTSIFTDETQPRLSLKDYSTRKRKDALAALGSADVAAVLSIKSPFTGDLLGLIKNGKLAIRELFCDCTSGDDISALYGMISVMMVKDAKNNPAVSLLSINENEVLLFEMLLRRSAEREELAQAEARKKQLIKEQDRLPLSLEFEVKREEFTQQIKEIEQFLRKGMLSSPFEAAKELNRQTGVPLLVHTKDGSYILGGGQDTSFIPSAVISFPKGASYVGAGDTLCGAMALALAVKSKSDQLLPDEKRLTHEDCLLFANLATGYRLAKINKADPRDNSPREWFESVGTIKEIYEWAVSVQFRESTEKPLPAGLQLSLVEKNSVRLASLGCLNEQGLLESILRNSGKKEEYATARVAFEELCTRASNESSKALAVLVADAGSPGNLFKRQALKVLANRGETGVECVAEASRSMDENSLREIATASLRLKPDIAAPVLYHLLAEGRHLDMLKRVIRTVSPQRLTDHMSYAIEETAVKPDFLENSGLFLQLLSGPIKNELNALGANIPLLYHLAKYAKKALLPSLEHAACTPEKQPAAHKMDSNSWAKFKKSLVHFITERLAYHTLGYSHEKTRSRVLKFANTCCRQYGLNKEEFDIAVLSASKQSHTFEYLGTNITLDVGAFLSLLVPPSSEAVKRLLLEKIKDADYSSVNVAAVSAELFKEDYAVQGMCNALLAKCIVGTLINPDVKPFYDDNSDSEYSTPYKDFERMASELKRALAAMPLEKSGSRASVSRRALQKNRDAASRPAQEDLGKKPVKA